MSFDSIFHGPPSSSIESGGNASLGVDVTNAQLYFRSASTTGWTPTGGSGANNPGVILANNQAGSTLDAQLENAIAALPSTGGTVDARGYATAQSFAASLTISKSNVTVLFPAVNISLGANQIIIAPGTMNVRLQGVTPYGGQWSSATSGGTFVSYTGNSYAIEVGASSADTIGFQMKDVYVQIAGAGSSAIGLGLLRCPQYRLDGCYFNAALTNCSQECLRLDGTGNYTGGTILECNFNGGQYGIHMTGTGNELATASTLLGNHFSGVQGVFSNPTSGIFFDLAGQNFVFGGDCEGYDIGQHFSGSASANYACNRYEGNTIDYQFDSGATYNLIVFVPTASTANGADNSGNFTNMRLYSYNLRLQPHYFEFITTDEAPTTWQVQNGESTAQTFTWNINQKAAHAWVLTVDTNQGLNFLRAWGTPGGFSFNGSSGNAFFDTWSAGSFSFNMTANSGTGGVRFGSGGASPSVVATISATGVITGNTLIEAETLSPTSGGTAGVTGQLAWDSGFLYVCTSGGVAGSATWKKVALSSD